VALNASDLRVPSPLTHLYNQQQQRSQSSATAEKERRLLQLRESPNNHNNHKHNSAPHSSSPASNGQSFSRLLLEAAPGSALVEVFGDNGDNNSNDDDDMSEDARELRNGGDLYELAVQGSAGVEAANRIRQAVSQCTLTSAGAFKGA
jgi:hypothetical protein